MTWPMLRHTAMHATAAHAQLANALNNADHVTRIQLGKTHRTCRATVWVASGAAALPRTTAKTRAG